MFLHNATPNCVAPSSDYLVDIQNSSEGYLFTYFLRRNRDKRRTCREVQKHEHGSMWSYLDVESLAMFVYFSFIFHLFFILFVNYQHLIEPLHVAEVWDREVMRSDSGGFWNWSHLARFKTRAEAVPGFSREGDETAEPDPGRPIKLYKLLGVHGVVAGGAARSVVLWNLLIQVFFAKKPKPLVFISSSVIFIIS